MGKKVTENIVTPAGTFKWTWLDKPDTSPKGKNKFKTAIILTKDNGGPNDTLAKKLNDLHKSVKGKTDKRPAKDGDAMVEDDSKNEWARGSWVITAKTKEKPKMVAADGKTVLAQPPRTGDFGRLICYATDYDADGTTGVSLYLNGVKLLKRNNTGGRDLGDVGGDESGEYGVDETEGDTTERDGEDGGEGGDGAGSDGDY